MNYLETLKSFSKLISKTCNSSEENFIINHLRHEAIVESIKDWSELESIHTVKDWFLDQQKKCPMTIKNIPLLDCTNWSYNQDKGVLEHESKNLFYIQGIRVRNSLDREVTGGWDQPILTQVNFKGGILGLLRTKQKSIPYYLVEAKAEPGNPDKVQISPTLQATFSNLKQVHKGKKPKFSNYFENPKSMNGIVLFEQWMSEDGGRLHLKKNKGMIVEVRDGITIPIPENYKWVTLYQIKYFIKKNSWVSPHIRSIISHL